MSKKIPNVIFVLGAPGSGKGTQCENIVKRFGYEHLSAGDLLRKEKQDKNSPYGALIDQHIRNGSIVPVEITCSLIKNAMESTGKDNFLIDGYPRNQDNLDGWEKVMSNKVNVKFVLFLDAPEDVCVDRCLKRGNAGSGRSDDNPESLRKRFVTYMNDTMPIVEHFRKQGAVVQVDASKSPDAVFEEITSYFDEDPVP